MEQTRKNKAQTCSTTGGTQVEHGTAPGSCSISVPLQVEQECPHPLADLWGALLRAGFTLEINGEKLKLRGTSRPPKALIERVHRHKPGLLRYLRIRNPPNPWIKLARGFLDWRDNKGRLEAVPSELDTCITGLKSDPSPEAQELVEELKASRKEAKNALNRYKARLKRQFKQKGHQPPGVAES